MLIEPLAGYRRLDTTRLALEQGRRELRLEVGDMMAERGLRDIGLVGRPRQVALLVDGDEIAKLARIQRFCVLDWRRHLR
jgi:hypothetical protein